ncbi:HEPN domain-containing protein [Methanoregula sp.]|jgi:HEPN domain-containing protein|uniref:HEPN domain-containing protein n=1 Tax=Methanoregula sp. TaxID=2052170 RepID=UPI003BAEE85B
MKNRSLAETWLVRARSNLSRARQGKSTPDIVYEDLCFDCEQAAEKALKGLLILKGIVPPQTHSLALLIEELEKHDYSVPDEVKTAVSLTHYAVSTRYPGSYEPVKEREYQKARKGAETVFAWVEQQF